MVGLGILEAIIQSRLLPAEKPPCKNCAEKSNKVLHDLVEQLSPEVETAWNKLGAGEINSKEFVEILRENYDNDKIEGLVNKLLGASEPNHTVEAEELVNKLLDQGEKLILYVSKLCEHCKTAKEYLGDMINSGEVNIVNIDANWVLAKFIEDNFGGVPALTIEYENKICEVNINTGAVEKCIDKKTGD